MADTGDRHKETVTAQGSRPQFRLAIMMLCCALFILYHQGNQNEEMPADALWNWLRVKALKANVAKSPGTADS